MCMGKEKPIDIKTNRLKSKFSYKALRPHHSLFPFLCLSVNMGSVFWEIHGVAVGQQFYGTTKHFTHRLVNFRRAILPSGLTDTRRGPWSPRIR